jgi:hypothetical protein
LVEVDPVTGSLCEGMNVRKYNMLAA